MKIIFAWSIIKKAKKMWFTVNYLYAYILRYRINDRLNLIKLCSPIAWTIAYKWYINKCTRIIIFITNEDWIISPVYIGTKNELIAKNITVSIVRKMTEKFINAIEKDISKWNYKILYL